MINRSKLTRREQGGATVEMTDCRSPQLAANSVSGDSASAPDYITKPRQNAHCLERQWWADPPVNDGLFVRGHEGGGCQRDPRFFFLRLDPDTARPPPTPRPSTAPRVPAALGSLLGDEGLFRGAVADCGGTAVWIRRLFCPRVAYVIDGVASSRVLSPRRRTPTSWGWLIAEENRNLLIYFVALFFKLDQSSQSLLSG